MYGRFTEKMFLNQTIDIAEKHKIANFIFGLPTVVYLFNGSFDTVGNHNLRTVLCFTQILHMWTYTINSNNILMICSGQKVKNGDGRTFQQQQAGLQQQFGNVAPPPGFDNRPFPYSHVAAGRKHQVIILLLKFSLTFYEKRFKTLLIIGVFYQDNVLNVASSKFGHLPKMGFQCVSPMEMGTEQYQNSFTNRKQPINRQGVNQEQLGACALPYRRVRSISGISEYSDTDGKVRLFCSFNFGVPFFRFFKFLFLNLQFKIGIHVVGFCSKTSSKPTCGSDYNQFRSHYRH